MLAWTIGGYICIRSMPCYAHNTMCTNSTFWSQAWPSVQDGVLTNGEPQYCLSAIVPKLSIKPFDHAQCHDGLERLCLNGNFCPFLTFAVQSCHFGTQVPKPLGLVRIHVQQQLTRNQHCALTVAGVVKAFAWTPPPQHHPWPSSNLPMIVLQAKWLCHVQHATMAKRRLP